MTCARRMSSGLMSRSPIRHDQHMNTGSPTPVHAVERSSTRSSVPASSTRPPASSRWPSSPASWSVSGPVERGTARPAAAGRGGRLPRRGAGPRGRGAVPVRAVGRARLRCPRVALLARGDRRSCCWSPGRRRAVAGRRAPGLREPANDVRRRLAGSLLTFAGLGAAFLVGHVVDHVMTNDVLGGLLAGRARVPSSGSWSARSATGWPRPPSGWSAPSPVPSPRR